MKLSGQLIVIIMIGYKDSSYQLNGSFRRRRLGTARGTDSREERDIYSSKPMLSFDFKN